MKKKPTPQPIEIGDPAGTPFVRFDSGIIYPPNGIYEAAQSVLGRCSKPYVASKGCELSPARAEPLSPNVPVPHSSMH